jgi:hypothetical protein
VQARLGQIDSARTPDALENGRLAWSGLGSSVETTELSTILRCLASSMSQHIWHV